VIGKYRILAVIPARGGSRGVPGKNIRSLLGKPLIAWTIEAAQQSRYLDRIIVSSNDRAIIDVAQRYGCEAPFVRPGELSQDDTPGIDPILHALDQLPGYDYVLMLQPTSPLRTSEDIDACMELCIKSGASSSVSVVEPDKSPFWMYQMNVEGKLSPLIDKPLVTRRQDLPISYALNGALYFAKIDWLKKTRGFIDQNTVGYIMPRERSYDIDTLHDFELCEYLLRKPVDNVDNSVHN